MTQEKDAERLRRVLRLIEMAVDELAACEPTPIITRAKGELAQQGLSLLGWRTTLEVLVQEHEARPAAEPVDEDEGS